MSKVRKTEKQRSARMCVKGSSWIVLALKSHLFTRTLQVTSLINEHSDFQGWLLWVVVTNVQLLSSMICWCIIVHVTGKKEPILIIGIIENDWNKITLMLSWSTSERLLLFCWLNNISVYFILRINCFDLVENKAEMGFTALEPAFFCIKIKKILKFSIFLSNK